MQLSPLQIRVHMHVVAHVSIISAVFSKARTVENKRISNRIRHQKVLQSIALHVNAINPYCENGNVETLL
jgi:hypothetical protein